jgi:transposase
MRKGAADGREPAMKWQELNGEERYRVVELARKGKTPMRELCQTFRVSRQTLYRAMEAVDRAAMEALEKKRPGRRGRSALEVRTTELETEKASMEMELRRWQQKYEVAKAILDLQRRAERGERLAGKAGKKKRVSKGPKSKGTHTPDPPGDGIRTKMVSRSNGGSYGNQRGSLDALDPQAEERGPGKAEERTP